MAASLECGILRICVLDIHVPVLLLSGALKRDMRDWDGANLGKSWVAWMKQGLGLRTQHSPLEIRIALEIVTQLTV